MNPQLFIGKTPPTAQGIEPVENRPDFGMKPYGGIWTSTFLNEDIGSNWVEFLTGIGAEKPLNGWILHPKKNINLYTIDSYQDLETLMKQYGCSSPIMELTGSQSPYLKSVDFKAFSQTFDGLHVTKQGQRDTHQPDVFEFSDGKMTHRKRDYTLYTYDVECTWFSKWCFEESESLTELLFR